MIDLFVVPIKDIACLTGVVDADPSEPFMDISYTSGATGTASVYGTSGAPIAGNTVEFSRPNGAVVGRVRLRSWSGGVSTGTLNVAENDDITPLVKAGDTVRVYQRFDLFPVVPYPVKSGGSVTWYEDYDVAYTDQTDNYPPVAVAGLPAIGYLENGSVSLNFYGDKSFAVKDGAGIANWYWDAPGSAEGSSTSAGTFVSPVVFTYTQAGQHLVSLTVTDTNGKTHTARTWAVVIDADSPDPIAYSAIGGYNDSQDFSNGGGSASVQVYGAVDSHVFADNGMVVVGVRGNIVGGVHPALDRDTTFFVGYIKSGTLSYSYDKSLVSFSLQTIDGVLRKTKTFPVSLINNDSPSTWLQARRLMVDKAAVHFLRWRTTALDITPFQGMGYNALIYRQDFNGGDAYSEVDRLYNDAWGRLFGDARGWLVGERNYQLMTTGTERALTESGVALDKDDWLNSLSIPEVRSFGVQTSRVDMEGVYYDGTNEPTPYFSTAPGSVPKAFGSGSKTGSLILTTQEDLNIRCGLGLAMETMKYPQINATFLNDVRFFTAPQRRFTLAVDAADNPLGLQWNAVVVPRKVSRRYNPSGKFFLTQVNFEADASGQPGVTVTMPANAPVPTTGSEPLASGTVSLVAGGSLWQADIDYTWLDSGFTGTVQGMMTDPYSNVAGTIPNMWYGGSGFVRWAEKPAVAYTDVTPSGTPVNVWGDTSVPAYNNVNFSLFAADVRTQGTIIAGGGWREASNGNYRFAIVKSLDGGVGWQQTGAWWLPSGLAESDVHGAYQASLVDSLNDSLVNQNRRGTHDLTIGNAPTWDSTNGWTFNGTSNYLVTDFTPQTEMTVIASLNYTTGTGYWFGVTEATKDMNAFVSYAVGITTLEAKQGTIVPSHLVAGAIGTSVIAVTASPYTSTRTVRIYQDGSQVAAQSYAGAYTSPSYSAYVGAFNGGGAPSYYFSGQIKALAIYTTELTAAQIAEVTTNMGSL